MAKITPFDYHDDEANHGSYQFVPLTEIVNELQFEYNQSGHYLEHTRRTLILYHAKECLRKFNKAVKNDPIAIEITVPENLVFALPHNYVNWLRVSVVVTDPSTDSYRLKPLDVNNNMNIAIGYLQDHNAEILFDEAGGILQADATSVYAKPYKKYAFSDTPNQKLLDTSKLSKWGEFSIDQRRGKIVFSSDLYDKEIVLEYLSDSLDFDTYGEETIKVHKDIIAMVKDWVYLECINPKRATDVPSNEKERARRRFMTTKHQAVMDRADLNMLEIARQVQSSSKH